MADMRMPTDVVGDANPRGRSTYRHWLSRTWSRTAPTALVIGINPNTATEAVDDAMTGFLTRLLRTLTGEFECGGYILVNCCDIRDSKPENVDTLTAPCSVSNFATIQEMLTKSDFVIASWGTAKYGLAIEQGRKQVRTLLSSSSKKVITFSPKGLPIYCSQTNKNSPGRWSDDPVRWAGA